MKIPDDVRTDLLQTLRAEEQDAIGYYDTTLADQQENALDFYEARPFGNEEEGRSQLVMPDVQEVVDYTTISVLQTILSSGNVIEFQAKEPDQEKEAQDATEAINYNFMKEQDGTNILTSWFQSGAIEKIGAIKTVCEESTERKRETATVDMETAMILDEEGLINEYEDNGDGSFTVVIEQEETVKKYRDYALPSEEFLFSARASHEDTAHYLAHRCRKTLSELIEMGFDREDVEALPVDDSNDYDDERSYSRWRDEDWTRTERKDNMREVVLFEEYIRYDVNDDGIGELLRVYRVENEILDVEEVDEQPFVVFTPYPRAHRMVGDAVAEKVMDIQLIRSTLVRNQFDAVYATNKPRVLLHEGSIGETTIEDLLAPDAGAIVRWKGQVPPGPLQDGYDISKSMGFLEFFTGERESRTGITRLNQGLEKDAFNATATGTLALQEKGEQMERYVGGNFVSCMARLFSKKQRLMIKHGALMKVRVDGEVKEISSDSWGEMDVVAKAGLGSHRKDSEIEYRRELLGLQIQGLQEGSRLFDDNKIYNNVSKLVKATKLGLPSELINDPEQMEPEEPRPDPEMAKAQADAMIKSEELKEKQVENKFNRDLKKLESDEKIKLMRDEAAETLRLDRDRSNYEARQSAVRHKFEMQMARERQEFDMEMSEKQVAAKTEEQKIKKNRPGGDLSK